ERRVGAEQVGQQLLDRLWAERQERKLLVIGPLHPLRVVLGAEVKEQQTAVPGCGVDHVLEECLARAVEPVQILEEEDGRLAGTAGTRKPADDLEELTLPRLRLHGWHRQLRIRHAEEIE